MNHEPLIDEANNAAAFITNEEGYDVALLQRVLEKSPVGEPRITDADWQSLVSLINAAPAMLEALRYIAGLDTSQDASPAQCSAVAVAMEAIDKSTK